MSRRRTAIVLAGIAGASVLATSAGCLLYQGGTYAYFSSSTSTKIKITTADGSPSPSSTPSKKNQASKKDTSTETPTPAATDSPTSGQHTASSSPTVKRHSFGHATSKPTGRESRSTDPQTPASGSTRHTKSTQHQHRPGDNALPSPTPRRTTAAPR